MPGPLIVNRPPLLKPENVVVADNGEIVTFTVGNSTLTLHYESALQISQLLRVHAKRAKRRAGDMSRHWSVVGTLESSK